MIPLVSILIPVFNHSDYIDECLDSILNLDYPNIELVLCDDGSKDDSYEKVKNWLHKNQSIRAKLFTQENQGVCKTLNRLIKESSGVYISICASDDFLIPKGIQQRVTALENNPTKLAVIGDAKLIDQDSNIIAASAMKYLYKADYHHLRNDLVSELVFQWSVVGPTLLIKRDAYNQVGLYDENLVVEDREFYLRLLKCDGLIFIPEIVSGYRIHTGNASRKSKSAKLVVLKEVATSNCKHFKYFHGFKRLFLASHKVDLFILKGNEKYFLYEILFIYRVIRFVSFRFFRFFEFKK
ncbi:glycosyltransferase [Shewanella baltica]|uniref:glycosyltransferase n=1 Tax=Shewanella baltica TaxID=62322 RepID=UPI0039AFD45F